MHLFFQVRKTIMKSVDRFLSCFLVVVVRRDWREGISEGYTTIFCGRRVS